MCARGGARRTSYYLGALLPCGRGRGPGSQLQVPAAAGAGPNGRPEYRETTSTGRLSAHAGTTIPRKHRSRLAHRPPGYVVVEGRANSYPFSLRENVNASHGPPSQPPTGPVRRRGFRWGGKDPERPNLRRDRRTRAHARRSSARAKARAGGLERQAPPTSPRPCARRAPLRERAQTVQGGGPRGGTRGACAERRLLSRGRTPLSHLPDKHHENSAAHTVIAAPAAGRVSTSPFPRGESESESEISPPPSSLRPPPAAAPATPAPDALRGRATARRPRPCGRPQLPRPPFPVPAASPPRALRPRQPPRSPRREPAPPPPPAAGRPWGRARASLPPGCRAPRRRDGRGAGRLRAPAGRPCHLSGTRGDGTRSQPRAGVCPGAPSGESARPRSAEGHGAGGGRSRGKISGFGPPPLRCGPSEAGPQMPVPPAPCERLETPPSRRAGFSLKT